MTRHIVKRILRLGMRSAPIATRNALTGSVKRILGLGVRLALLKVGARWYPAAKPHVVQTRVHDSELLVLANEDVGRHILMLRQYEPRDSELLSRLIRPADICLDIGGNTGYYTMRMARAASEGQVHVFEPVPLNWHLLCAGVLLNGYRHVTVNRCAVGAEDGEMGFSEATDGAYSSLVPVGRKGERGRLTVEVRALDSYVQEHALPRVDVIKIDIEGAEPLAMQGARQLLADAARRPRLIMMELQQTNLAAYGATVAGMIDRLREHGYEARVAPADGPVRPFIESDTDVYINVFFMPLGSALPA
jgi:FkbM family methyltransferase